MERSGIPTIPATALATAVPPPWLRGSAAPDGELPPKCPLLKGGARRAGVCLAGPCPVHSRAALSSFPRNSRLRGNDRESSTLRERRRRHGHGTAGVPPAHEKRHSEEQSDEESPCFRGTRFLPAVEMTKNIGWDGTKRNPSIPATALITCHSPLVTAVLLFPPFGRGTFFCLPKRKAPSRQAPA